MNEDEKSLYIAQLLILNYGDLLKVSRVRGMPLPLPTLRKYIAEEEAVRDLYKSYLDAEIEGMGLGGDMQLRGLQQAQLEAFAECSTKNSTIYADEIKKLITKGKADRELGQAVSTMKTSFDSARVWEFIEDPLDFDLETLTEKEAREIERILLADFKLFALWSFQIQMGFKFIMMDYHEVMFQFCEKIINGEAGFQRTIINIP